MLSWTMSPFGGPTDVWGRYCRPGQASPEGLPTHGFRRPAAESPPSTPVVLVNVELRDKVPGGVDDHCGHRPVWPPNRVTVLVTVRTATFPGGNQAQLSMKCPALIAPTVESLIPTACGLNSVSGEDQRIHLVHIGLRDASRDCVRRRHRHEITILDDVKHGRAGARSDVIAIV
jgi:hypothetical protein